MECIIVKKCHYTRCMKTIEIQQRQHSYSETSNFISHDFEFVFFFFFLSLANFSVLWFEYVFESFIITREKCKQNRFCFVAKRKVKIVLLLNWTPKQSSHKILITSSLALSHSNIHLRKMNSNFQLFLFWLVNNCGLFVQFELTDQL